MQLKHARTFTSALVVITSLLAAGCGFKSDASAIADASGTGPHDAGATGPDATTGPHPDASTGNGLTMPVIDSLTASPMTLVDGGTTITATAHDSQAGVAITSVKLTDTATGIVYGAFTSTGSGFTFVLTWGALEGASAINFVANTTQPRVVAATFVDANNNSVSGTLTLTLACPTGQTAQSGVCADLATDINNCGAVGNKCTSSKVCEATFDLGCECVAGECASAIPAIVTTATTCDSVCASYAATCAPNTCEGLPMGGAVEVSLTKLSPMACSDLSPTKPTSIQTIDCCCQQ